MSRKEQVEICRKCNNNKFDFKHGIICGLTGSSPTFQTTCDNFVVLEKIASDLQSAEIAQRIDHEYEVPEEKNRIKNGANWFYWIAGLSLINSFLWYIEADISFIVGLGITQLIDGILFGLLGEISYMGLIPNVLFSGLFVLFGYYANKLSKGAFITGLVIYGVDSILFILFEDFLSFGFHIFAFVMITRGLISLNKTMKEITLEENTEVMDG